MANTKYNIFAGVALTLLFTTFKAQAVSIGAILPLTGASASIGDEQRRGIELAVEDLNNMGGVLGEPISVITEDSGNSVTIALDAATKLNTVNHVPIVIGEYASSISIPIGQYLVKNGLVHLNVGSSSPQMAHIGNSSFGLIGLDTLAATFAAKDVIGMGYKRVAFIGPNGAFGQGLSDEFKKDIESAGGTLAANVLYNPGQSSYQRELQQIMRTRPDIYVYTAYGQEAVIINRNAYQLALNKVPWYGIYETMCVSDTPVDLINGQMGMDVASSALSGQEFIDKYKKKYGFGPKSSFASYAYDAVMFAATGMEKAHSEDPAKIIPALKELGATYTGVTGIFGLNADNQRTTQPYDKLVVKNGALTNR